MLLRVYATNYLQGNMVHTMQSGNVIPCAPAVLPLYCPCTAGVVPVLCQEITNKCAGKVYAAPSAPAVADSNSHNAEQDGTASAGQRSEL